MKRFLAPLLFIIILISTIFPACKADKITTDPNTLNITEDSSYKTQQDADLRLNQKVTYQKGYARLHDIADDLTKITGIKIIAGQNSKDWRIRDIPLVVCVKDLPADELLQTIAACTHVRLKREKTTNDDKSPIYRFYRNKKEQEELDSTFENRIEANNKLSAWAWDTLAAYATMPDTPLKITNEIFFFGRIDQEQIRLVGNVLASLGPDCKAKALSGEQISIKGASSPQIMQLFRYAATHLGYGWSSSLMDMNQPLDVTQQDAEKSALFIKIQGRTDNVAYGGFSFIIHGLPIPDDHGGGHDFWQTDPVKLANALVENKDLKLPPPPDVSSVFTSDEEFPCKGFSILKSDDDLKTPALQKKVNLGIKEQLPPQAEVLTEFAKKAEINIICEDFVSHKSKQYSGARGNLNSDECIATILQKMESSIPSEKKWFLNPSNQLLVGCAADWKKNHLNLVEENLLLNIRNKRDTTGADIDDVVPLTRLTHGQFYEWVTTTPNYFGFDNINLDTQDMALAVWRLYDALCVQDKRLAASDAGLPLAKFDPRWLCDFFKYTENEANTDIIRFSLDNDQVTKKQQILSDPEWVSSLTLRLILKPLQSWPIRTIDENGRYKIDEYIPGKNGIKKNSYIIELTGKKDDKDFQLSSEWPNTQFPLFTPEKEAELIKKAENDNKTR